MSICADNQASHAGESASERSATFAALRLGIVGCGRVAEQCHIPAALTASGVELAALVDDSRERLSQVADRFDLSCVATTCAADLAGHVDAVLVAVPNHLHHPVASAFLEAGVHVLCEKPLAPTAAEARHLCELAEARGVVLAVGYVKRFEPNSDLLKRLLRDDFLGRLDRFRYEYGAPGEWTPWTNYNLRRDQAGGGVLVTNGSHLLDRVIDWFGYPARVTYTDDAHGGVEANCSVGMTFDSGLTGVVTVSKTRRLGNEFQLDGERGRFVIAGSERTSIAYFPAGQPGVRHVIALHPEPAALTDVETFRLQIEDFACAIGTGERPRVPGREGLLSVELIEHCYRVRAPRAEPWVTAPLAAITRTVSGRAAAAASAARRPHGTGRVLVTGSTGFVGSRLCEVLHLATGYQARPLVRSSGKAAGVARYPLDFALGDLTDFASVRRAVDGCAFVVHLARGSQDVMIGGLKNVLRAAVEARVRRFVHVSSVAVYGDNPPPSAQYESAVPSKTGNPYGDLKLEQERLVAAYARRYGLPVVILRPPHVFGPGSHFVDAVAERLMAGRLAIVGSGDRVANLVYVDNLIEAILLGLDAPEAAGETFFITDTERVTWSRCLTDLGAALGIEVPAATVDQLTRPDEPSLSARMGRLASVLLSNEVRAAAIDMPGAGAVAGRLSRAYAALPEKYRRRIRARLEHGKVSRPPASRTVQYDATDYLIASQQRRIVHSCDKARRVLGYTAPVGYAEAMAWTRAWLGSQDGVAQAG